MGNVAVLGVPTCMPQEFSKSSQVVYSLQSWIDGTDVEELLTLYIASNILSSLPWAISFGKQQIATRKKQAKEVLFWYDDIKNLCRHGTKE